MAIDFAARAAQIGRIVDHAGEPLTYGALSFRADVSAWIPPVTDTDRNTGDDTCVLVKASRGAFTSGLPKQGESFRDAAGRNLRIQSLPSLPLSQPLVHFICAVSPLT